MARLLTDTNYLGVTLSDNVRELIAEYRNQWLDSEQVAQSEMISYLKQRYIINQIFTDTTFWDITLQYSGKNLIQYTETAWNDLTSYTGSALYVAATTYAINNTVSYYGYIYTSLANGNTGNLPTDATKWSKGVRTNRVSYKGYIYECISASTGYVPTNATYWRVVTEDNAYYYITLPYDEWDVEEEYAVSDQVWFLNKSYTAAKANLGIDPSLTNSTTYWGTGTTYLTTAGVFPDNQSVWTKGDNRNALIVRYLLDITAYHFMRAVPARGIPVHIKEAYNGNDPMDRGGAIGWLKRVAAGDINAELPNIVITQGLSFTGGASRTKQDNFMW